MVTPRYLSAAQAQTAATEVLKDAWDPGSEIYVIDKMTQCDGMLEWADALAAIDGNEVMDPVEPAALEVELWTVHFSDPPCAVTIVVDADGEVCAAGLMDDIDMMG